MYSHVFPCIPLYSLVFPCIPLYSLVFPCIPLHSLAFPCSSLSHNKTADAALHVSREGLAQSNMAVSVNDQSVLESIFNPLLPLGGDIPQEEVTTADENDSGDAAEEAKQYELLGVHKAEAGEYEDAMEYFNKAISTAPTRASGYNNRAQLWRIKGEFIMTSIMLFS